MGSVNHHTSWWITWRLLSIRVGAQLKAGSESKGQTKRHSLSTWFVVPKRKNEGEGGWGWWPERGFIFPRYSDTIVKPPTSPAVRGTGWSEAARFLISFLIPPDPIRPGPACCNPWVRYPPMFNMLMPTTKWMNHRGTQARHHFKKDRCTNTPENPCLLLDNRLSINGPSTGVFALSGESLFQRQIICPTPLKRRPTFEGARIACYRPRGRTLKRLLYVWFATSAAEHTSFSAR